MVYSNFKPISDICGNQEISRSVWRIDSQSFIYGHNQRSRAISAEPIGKINEDNIDVSGPGALLSLPRHISVVL